MHGLGLKSRREWRDYYKSGKKPADIPSAPNSTYAKDGWCGFGDWLGTGTVATHQHQYRPFEEARAFVRSRGLKSQTEWRRFYKSGKKPTIFQLVRIAVTRKMAGLDGVTGLATREHPHAFN